MSLPRLHLKQVKPPYGRYASKCSADIIVGYRKEIQFTLTHLKEVSLASKGKLGGLKVSQAVRMLMFPVLSQKVIPDGPVCFLCIISLLILVNRLQSLLDF